ncbi:ROK family transcriptional regulator [Fundicoccus culcitae]|uniref:ROK family transcriptional regulator n=1 Tax=Fundicoccus culcitae TaxID=2969821 RepID=A0ABY5P4A1_9LACT|nr:ROK family transcriptional regulator [Fundicoccus culcitae]UUX33522.1 ROK family transcriptional regulator [Fundicoccus culcitae]
MNKGLKPSDISLGNKNLIVRLITNNEIMSRSEISRITGLSEAAVSKIVASLIDNKILKEGEFVKGIRGRRAIGVTIDNETYRILSVHLSRRYFKIGKFNLSGECEESKVIEFETINANEMLKQVIIEVKNELSKDNRYLSLGVAVPGPFDMQTGVIMLMTEIIGFDNINIKDVFENEIDIPVIITHDANAGALACINNESERMTSNLAYYLVGEGVGVGVINEGNLVLGNRGVAGELGHVSIDHQGKKCKCGNHGCLELYCSSLSIINQAISLRWEYTDSKIFSKEKITIRHIVECADNNDLLAMKILKEAGYYISLGVLNIINSYNPEEIIIGDELSIASKYIQSELDEVLNERGISDVIKETSIIYADPQVDYILKGAAINAIDETVAIIY